MTTIMERADATIAEREHWVANAKKAKELIALLPDGLKELDGEADCYGEKEDSPCFKATFFEFFNHQIDLLKVAKIAGVQGLALKMNTPSSWSAEGRIMLTNGMEAAISLRALPAPPTCRIEEYAVTVTRYRAICPETGEEIK